MAQLLIARPCSCTNDCITSCMINGLTNYTTNCTINCTLPQEHWKFSTAITIGSIASFLSYSLITCLILIPVNVIEHAQTRIGQFCKKCIKHVYEKAENGVLSPFDDTDKLGIVYFYTNYIFVHILFIGCLVSSILYIKAVYNQKDNHNQTLIYNLGSCWNNQVNVARIAFHLMSQFCAIQSYFIFSKIVYNVTNRLDNLFGVISDLLDFERTNETHVVEDEVLKNLLQSTSKEKVDKGRYIWLQKIDQEFIEKVEPTLDLFGIWFIFHWVSFALTAMLLTGYILQILMHIAENSAEMILKGKLILDAFIYRFRTCYHLVIRSEYSFLHVTPRLSLPLPVLSCLCDCCSSCEINTQNFQEAMDQCYSLTSEQLHTVPHCTELCIPSALVLCYNPLWIQLGLCVILHSYLWCLPKDTIRTLQSSSRLQPTSLLAIVIENHCTAFV